MRISHFPPVLAIPHEPRWTCLCLGEIITSWRSDDIFLPRYIRHNLQSKSKIVVVVVVLILSLTRDAMAGLLGITSYHELI